ncbi:ribonuclease T2 family protein [Rhodoblastus sp.]|uniref:ribonuclease T2 family protein n=1 Tax=Rhodoblastus sp. TaxID=1962975 RepID=UPI003F9D6EEC
MKALLAAILTLLVAAPAFAGDCILDNCADRQPLPEAQASPAGGFARGGGFGRGVWRGGGASGDFDFYVLSLSWSPSFCETTGSRRPSAQCAPGANPGFVVHGLWPQNDNGYPSQCSGDSDLPYSVLSRLGDLYPDPGLARHEWRQHGLCSGKPPAGYFADVRAARDSIVVPPALKAPQGDQRMAPLDIQRAFMAANPRLRAGMMAVTCRRGAFQEARFCLSKDLRNFVACPQVAREGCRGQSVVVPAGQ